MRGCSSSAIQPPAALVVVPGAASVSERTAGTPSSAFITIRRTKLATGLSSRAAAASSRAFNSASIGTLNCGPRSSRIEILGIRCAMMRANKNYRQRTLNGVQNSRPIPMYVMSRTSRPDDTASCGEPGCAGKEGTWMDLHRIPDDLSIPEFLKRNRRRIRSDYELDDVASRVLIKTWRKLNNEDKALKRE